MLIMITVCYTYLIIMYFPYGSVFEMIKNKVHFSGASNTRLKNIV